MADLHLIRIDLAKLAAHLTAAERRPVSQADAAAWLRRNGFVPRLDGSWLVESVSVAVLAGDEWAPVKSAL